MRDEKKTRTQLIHELEILRQQLNATQPRHPADTPDLPPVNLEALRRSEERFYRVFHASPVGISLSIPADGQIVDANDSFLALLGRSRQDLIGRTAFELDMWSNPEQRARVMSDLMRDGSIHDLELKYHARHGDYRDVLVSFDLIDLEGRQHVLGFHIDITERNRVAKNLQHQLAENARLLQQANRRAREIGALMHISSVLRQTSQRSQMIPILINETMAVSNAQAAGIILRADDFLSLTGATLHGDLFSQDIPLQDTCGSLLNSIQTGQPLFLSDQEMVMETCPELLALMQGMQAGAFIPLKTVSAILGLLYVAFRDDGQKKGPDDLIPPELRRLLEAISDVGGNALQRANIMESLEKRVNERTRQIATLYDITTVASNQQDLKTMLELVLEKVLEAMHSPAGSIHLKEDDPLSLRLFIGHGLGDQDLTRFDHLPISEEIWGEDIHHAKLPILLSLSPRPAFLQEAALDQYALYIGAPVRAKGELIGLLGVLGQTFRSYTPEDMVQLMAIADQVGVIVENARLRKQAEQAAIIEERQRLSRELHDSVNQLLYSLALFARGGRNYMETNQWKLAARSLIDIDETAQQALKEMRLLLYELRPGALEQAGLVEALRYRLEAVEQRAGVDIRLVVSEPLSLPPEAEKDLYRVAQEALNNALKHAAANQITINLSSPGDHKVKLEIIDNGRGFDPQTASGGLGLGIMRERMVRLGGSLTIFSKTGEGTRVLAELNTIPPNTGLV